MVHRSISKRSNSRYKKARVMIKVSREFKIRLKLHELPAYKIAQQAGVHHVTLSKLINGIDPVQPGDKRIVRVAKVLGLTCDEAFDAFEDVENLNTEEKELELDILSEGLNLQELRKDGPPIAPLAKSRSRRKTGDGEKRRC